MYAIMELFLGCSGKHKLDIENGKLKLSMDELESRFDSVNIPVSLACDGNRRGGLNLTKKSKGFSWG